MAHSRYGFGIAGLLPAVLLGSVSALAVAAGASRIAQAAPAKPRIAVISIAAEQLSAEVRARIDAAVAGGLAASGADVVDSMTTMKRISAKGLRGCDTSTCRTAIAEVTGASYLVRGSVESMGRSYTVRLEMVDGATGAVIGMREDRCEICTESEAYETASVTASALKAEVLKRPAPAAAAAEPASPARNLASAVPPANAPSGDASLVLGSGSPGTEPARSKRAPLGTLTWVGIGAGAAAVVAGAALVWLDGHGTCSLLDTDQACKHQLVTKTGGMALIGGGALAAALSVILLSGRF